MFEQHRERREAAARRAELAAWQARRDGYVTTLYGRRRDIPELRSSNRQTEALGERLAVNTVVQGTSADVMKLAMIEVAGTLAATSLTSRMIRKPAVSAATYA